MISQVSRDILALIGSYMTLAPDIRTFKLVSKRFNMVSYDAIIHLYPGIKGRIDRLTIDDKILPPLSWIMKHRFLEILEYPFYRIANKELPSIIEKLLRLRHLFIINTHFYFDVDINIWQRYPQISFISILSTSFDQSFRLDISKDEVFISSLFNSHIIRLIGEGQRLYGAKRLMVDYFDIHMSESLNMINAIGFTEIHFREYCRDSGHGKINNVKELGTPA